MHRGDQCQTWLSHFAMILQFEGDDQDTKWILQRDAGDAGGVEFFPCGNDFDWNWGSVLRFDGRRHVWHATLHFRTMTGQTMQLLDRMFMILSTNNVKWNTTS